MYHKETPCPRGNTHTHTHSLSPLKSLTIHSLCDKRPCDSMRLGHVSTILCKAAVFICFVLVKFGIVCVFSSPTTKNKKIKENKLRITVHSRAPRFFFRAYGAVLASRRSCVCQAINTSAHDSLPRDPAETKHSFPMTLQPFPKQASLH